MVDVVTITKRKRPRGTGRWAGYRLAEDAFGAWVFTPAHSIFRSHDGAGAGWCEVAQDEQGVGRDSMVLLPLGRWWVTTWTAGSERVVTADISTPPVRTRAGWEFDDLELDPWRGRDGEFGVEDVDEFDAAMSLGLISHPEANGARAALDELRSSWGDPASGIVDEGERRLATAIESALAPLDPDDLRTGRGAADPR